MAGVATEPGSRIAPVRGCAGQGVTLDAAGVGQPVCCRSSVVEHSLGKGEVESSILSGSTIQLPEIVKSVRWPATLER